MQHKLHCSVRRRYAADIEYICNINAAYAVHTLLILNTTEVLRHRKCSIFAAYTANQRTLQFRKGIDGDFDR